jgi:hypothetical protein
MTPLKTFNESFAESTHTLTGEVFTLSYQYNQRADRFFVTITASDGTVIVKGRKLLPGRNLLRGCSSAKRPKGSLVLTARAPRTDAPGMGDLGDVNPNDPQAGAFVLTYLEPGE